MSADQGHAAVACIAVALAILCAIGYAGKARGQEHHHPLHEQFYSTWQKPGGGSCCDARKTVDGVELGDCEPSEAKLAAGKDGLAHWFARLPHHGDFIEIPDAAVIRQRNPEQGGPDGHLCYSYGTIHCFVPPDTGG